MSRPVVVDAQMGFGGGINPIADHLDVGPKQFRFGQNARLTEYGAVTRRYGSYIYANTLPASVQGGYSWRKDDGSLDVLAISNGVLHTSTFSVPDTWVAKTGAFSTAARPRFAQFRESAADVVYIADGGLLNKWDGTTVTVNIAGGPNVGFIKVHNQRLWGVGDTTAPDSIFYSALNNGDGLGNAGAGGGQIVVRTFGDEKLVGLASVGSSLLIFHRRGVSRLTGFGQDDTQVDPEGVSSQTGTIAPDSIVEVDGMCYFVSDRGLYAATEGVVAAVGSPETPDPILPLVQNLTESQLQQVTMVLSRRSQELWIYIPGTGVVVYHLILKAWCGPWIGEYASLSAMWGSNSTTATTYVLRGDSTGVVTVSDAPGYVRDGSTYGSPTTTGVDVPMLVKLRRLHFEDASAYKSWRFGYLTATLGGGALVTVSWESESGVGQNGIVTSLAGVWGTGVWGTGVWGGLTSKNYRVQMGKGGYYADISILDNNSIIPILSRWQSQAFVLGRR